MNRAFYDIFWQQFLKVWANMERFKDQIREIHEEIAECREDHKNDDFTAWLKEHKQRQEMANDLYAEAVEINGNYWHEEEYYNAYRDICLVIDRDRFLCDFNEIFPRLYTHCNELRTRCNVEFATAMLSNPILENEEYLYECWLEQLNL